MSTSSPKPDGPRTLWPFGLTLTISFFAVVLLAFVAWSTTQPVDLVAKDYYEQELAFQDEIERRQRSSVPEHRPELDLEGRTLVLSFPSSGLPESGEIKLYRPSNANLDQTFEVDIDPEGRQRIDLANAAVGAWWLELRWTIGDEEFSWKERLALG